MKNKVVRYLTQTVNELINVLYPDLCIACYQLPKTRGGAFCVTCMAKMPYTDHFVQSRNVVSMHFWGRVPLAHGGALLTYTESGIVSTMIHGLKYKKRKHTGIVLGQLAGEKLKSSTLFGNPDIMIPVPLTDRKKTWRGYNQSAAFGEGIQKILPVPLDDSIIKKIRETESQTSKSRTERVENVRDSFIITAPEKVKGKHVLLLDDVVTTGATVEACCLTLIDAGVREISLLTIAAGEK